MKAEEPYLTKLNLISEKIKIEIKKYSITKKEDIVFYTAKRTIELMDWEVIFWDEGDYWTAGLYEKQGETIEC